MSFQFKIGEHLNEMTFENIINPWKILKEVDETPYLKSFIIKNYAGGNTLVPREAWKEEGILYQEIEKNIFLFPYESIGFVLDDSISSLDLTVVDEYEEANDDNTPNFILQYNVENVETCHLKLIGQTGKISRLATLYLFSKIKIGYDNDILRSIEKCIRPLINSETNNIDYVDSTLSIGLKGLTFVIRVNSDKTNTFYKITCKGRCKKNQLKENQIRSLGYLKKKIMHRNPAFPLLYSLLLLSLLILIYVWIGKTTLILFLFLLLLKGFSLFLKKRLPLILKKIGFLKFHP